MINSLCNTFREEEGRGSIVFLFFKLLQPEVPVPALLPF